MKKNIKGKILFGGDKPLWVVFMLLCVISILVIYSSTISMAYKDMGGDTSHFVLQQLKFIVVGFVAAYVVHLLNPALYIKYARNWFIMGLFLTFLVYTPLGMTINGASRWLPMPIIGGTLMPSDLLRVALVLMLARELGRRQEGISDYPIIPKFSASAWRQRSEYWNFVLYQRTIPLVVPIVVSAVAVMWANLSTALIILFFSCVMLWVGRVRLSYIGRFLMMVMGLGVGVIMFMQLLGVGRSQTWVNRGASYVNSVFGVRDTEDKTPEDDFQKMQAKIAVASGGFMGKGPGNSTQRSQLPHPYSDFAYAFIVEEYGFVGGGIILALYLWVLFRSIVIMHRCSSVTESLVVMGLALIITSSAFVNICVSTGVVPVTGQSLPLISLGGTSIMITAVSFGMILGISRKNDRLAKIVAKKQREQELQKQLETEKMNRRIQKQEQVYGEEFRSLDPIRARMHARKVNEQYGVNSSEIWDGEGEFGVRDYSSDGQVGEGSGEGRGEREVFNLED